MKRDAVLLLAVVLLTAGCFAYLSISPEVRFVFRDEGLATSFTPHTLGGLDLALDHLIAGAAPQWFHFRSLIWHLAAVGLVIVLFRRFGATSRAAALGALVFAIHPAGVEAVACSVARGELLAVVLFLAALWFHRRSEGLDAWFVATLVLLLLALSSGKGAISFAIAAFLLDGCFRYDGKWKATLRRWPRYVAYAAMTVVVVGAREAAFPGPGNAGALALTIGVASSTILRSVVYGLRLLVLPVDPAADYLVRPGPGADLVTILSAAVVLVLAVVAIRRLAKRNGVVAFATVWFLATLLPAAAFAVLVRRPFVEPLLGIPLIGPSFATGQIFARAFDRGVVARALTGMILVCLVAVTAERVPDFTSNATLSSATLGRSDSPRALCFEADDLTVRGRKLIHQAGILREERHAGIADALGRKGLELLYRAAHVLEKATRAQRRTFATWGEEIEVRLRRARLYVRIADHDLALQQADEALKHDPGPCRGALRMVRAQALMGMRNFRAAAREADRAVRCENSPAMRKAASRIWRRLGRRYLEIGYRDAKAYEAYRRSWELLPSKAENASTRAYLDKREREFSAESTKLEKEIRQHPEAPAPRRKLAILEARMGHFEVAKKLFERLLSRDGSNRDLRREYARYCFEATDTLEGYARAEAIYKKLEKTGPYSKKIEDALSRVANGQVTLRASLAQ